MSGVKRGDLKAEFDAACAKYKEAQLELIAMVSASADDISWDELERSLCELFADLLYANRETGRLSCLAREAEFEMPKSGVEPA